MILVVRRGDLTGSRWAVLEPLLPRGKKAVRSPKWSKRQLINGIRWRIRAEAPRQDLPGRYGPWETCSGSTQSPCAGLTLYAVLRAPKASRLLGRRMPYLPPRNPLHNATYRSTTSTPDTRRPGGPHPGAACMSTEDRVVGGDTLRPETRHGAFGHLDGGQAMRGPLGFGRAMVLDNSNSRRV